MNWDDLQYILALHRAGSLSGAAKQLGVNHATVSRRVSAFEAAAGSEAFVKTREGYVLTAFGEQLVASAKEVEQGMLGVERVIRNADDSLSGDVRVTTSQMMSELLVLPVVCELKKQHPGVVVDVIEATRFFNLARQEADIAVRAQTKREAIGSSSVRVRYLGATHWFLFANDEVASTDPMPVIPFDRYSVGQVGVDWLAQHADRIRVVMQTNSIYSGALAAERGVGAVFLPGCVGRNHGLRPLTEPMITTYVYAAVHSDLVDNPRIRLVFERLVAYAAESRSIFDA